MGKKLVSVLGFLLFIIFIPNVSALAGTDILTRCRAETAQDKNVYMSDFSWGYSLQDMLKKALEIYVSGKRLKNRAYYEPALKAYVMPASTSEGAKLTILNLKFIENIKNHIEDSMKKHYADAVFFPDMGHSHLLVPEQMFKTEFDVIDYAKDKNIFYEKLFSKDELQILYHTAEQLKMREEDKGIGGALINDGYLLHRYNHRNVVGKNDGTKEVYTVSVQDTQTFNTVREVEGYHYWGAGFALNASQDGCFSFEYENKTYFYDLSFDDPGSSPELADVHSNEL